MVLTDVNNNFLIDFFHFDSTATTNQYFTVAMFFIVITLFACLTRKSSNTLTVNFLTYSAIQKPLNNCVQLSSVAVADG